MRSKNLTTSETGQALVLLLVMLLGILAVAALVFDGGFLTSPGSSLRGISGEAGMSLGEGVSPARVPASGQQFGCEPFNRITLEVGGPHYINAGINSCQSALGKPLEWCRFMHNLFNFSSFNIALNEIRDVSSSAFRPNSDSVLNSELS